MLDYSYADFLTTPPTLKNIRTVVLYHSTENDGKFCAACLVRAHAATREDIVCVGANYETDFDIFAIKKAIPTMQILFVVDYNLSPANAIKLCNQGVKIVWIDHNSTAVTNYLSNGFYKAREEEAICYSDRFTMGVIVNNLLGSMFKGYYPVNYDVSAGGMISAAINRENYKLWQGLMDGVPYNVGTLCKYVSDWDVQATTSKKWTEATYFNAGSALEDMSPHSYTWAQCFWDKQRIEEVLTIGKSLTSMANAQATTRTNSYAGKLTWKSTTFAAVNTDTSGAVALDTSLLSSVQAILTYVYVPSDSKWKVSMYKRDGATSCPDLATIATEYGGSGQETAAAFSIATLPFTLADITNL